MRMDLDITSLSDDRKCNFEAVFKKTSGSSLGDACLNRFLIESFLRINVGYFVPLKHLDNDAHMFHHSIIYRHALNKTKTKSIIKLIPFHDKTNERTFGSRE